MPNDKNKKIVEELAEKIQKAKSITFMDYLGLSANMMSKLRQQMKDVQAETTIAKNTLLKIALNKSNMDTTKAEEENTFKGPTAIVFAYEDAIAPLKKLVEFAKAKDNLKQLPKIKSGFVEGMFADATQMEKLSNLPSKEELLGQVVGTLKAPLNNFVGVLSGVQRQFVQVLTAIKDKKE